MFECSKRLKEHQKMLRELAPLVGTVVWVATPGSDDSHQLARQAAGETGGLYLEVPPGLYAAWNEGIRHVTSNYLYISTVGGKITFDGLRTMLDLMERHQADLCSPPPQILPQTPERLRRIRHWPVFRYRRALRPLSPLNRARAVAGPPADSQRRFLCDGFLRLRTFPYPLPAIPPLPLDFQHYGDTAWFYRHLFNLRTIYLEQACSTFHVHDFTRRQIFPSDLRRCVDLLAADYLAKYPRSNLPRWALDLQQAREKLDHLRKPHPYRYWWMSPTAWGCRFRRDWIVLKIRLNMEWQLGRAGRNPQTPTPES